MKTLTLGILLTLMNSFALIGQENEANYIQKSIEYFNSLTNQYSKYELEFIEEKKTLYFKLDLDENNIFGYKAILDDVHPEGIFILKYDDKTILRILSIHNGKVFVREVYREQFRHSNNTNLIDIELPKNMDDQKLKELVQRIKMIFVNEEKETPIQILEPPKSKNY